MHPNKIFHSTDAEKDLEFARARGFGTLAISTAAAPLVANVPFLLSEDGTDLDLHLVRSNPIVTALKSPRAALVSVSGPDSYISPDWYGIPDQVPTWNYVSVEIRGTLALLPTDELLDMLDRQSAAYEARLKPKSPWKTSKMTPEILDRMMRTIIPCRLRIEEVGATWKLGQNKPAEARLRAAEAVEAAAFGSGTEQIAALMRTSCAH